MFDAPEPIYDDLFEYLKDNFLLPSILDRKAVECYIPSSLEKDPRNPGEFLRDADGNLIGDLKPFKKFERGIIYQTSRNTDLKLYPMGYLEWGQVGEIEDYQSPHGYKYDLTYPICLLTFQKEGTPDNAVFTKKTGDGFYGIGDLVTVIVRDLWASFKKSRFMSARSRYDATLQVPGDTLAADETDWWIIDWSLDVANKIGPQPGETDTLVANSTRQGNPLVRGTQINLKFEVFERDTLK